MPEVIGPSGFILLRVLGAGLLFWALYAFRPERVSAPDLARAFLCAITGVALNQLMFFHGLMRTSPLNASIIMVATPILVLVLAGVLLRERITWPKAVGVALGAGGALALILAKPSGGAAGATAAGSAAAAAAVRRRRRVPGSAGADAGAAPARAVPRVERDRALLSVESVVSGLWRDQR